MAKQFVDIDTTARLLGVTVRHAPVATMKPVPTPFDGQIPQHGRMKQQRMVRKAVGAEGMQFDLSELSVKDKPSKTQDWFSSS